MAGAEVLIGLPEVLISGDRGADWHGQRCWLAGAKVLIGRGKGAD